MRVSGREMEPLQWWLILLLLLLLLLLPLLLSLFLSLSDTLLVIFKCLQEGWEGRGKESEWTCRGAGAPSCGESLDYQSWIYGKQLLSGWQTCEEHKRRCFSSCLYQLGLCSLLRRKEDCVCCASTHNGESTAFLPESLCVLFLLELPLKIMCCIMATFDLLWNFLNFCAFFVTLDVLWLLCSPHRRSLGFRENVFWLLAVGSFTIHGRQYWHTKITLWKSTSQCLMCVTAIVQCLIVSY